MAIRADVTPQRLAQGLVIVVADATGCKKAWADREAPLTAPELEGCLEACVEVFRRCGLAVSCEVRREPAAREETPSVPV